MEFDFGHNHDSRRITQNSSQVDNFLTQSDQGTLSKRHGRADSILEEETIEQSRKHRIKQKTKEKLATLRKQNLMRQTDYFGKTQHKFMKTTNEHGGVVEDDEEDPSAGRSLY